MNTHENITLHETDLPTLKKLAIYAAEQLAQKATTFDEYHQIIAALETELRRINQLPFVPTEIANPYILLNREDRFLLEKAKKLQAQGKLKFIERYGSSQS